MGSMTNRKACRGAWVLVLVVLAGVSPGIAEAPDLSGVSAAERKMIESACLLEKSVGGPAAYNRCLASQLRELRGAPTAPDLSGVSSAERKMIEENNDIARSRQAAEQGNADAQVKLADIHTKSKDYAEALKWYRKAAVQGYAPAQHGLGLMYHKGEGVLEDYREAVKWYRKAAEQGHAGAQNNLGNMYHKGYGVPEDYVKAYAWYILAASQGIERAAGNKDALRLDMTGEQITEAQKLAAELHRRIESSNP